MSITKQYTFWLFALWVFALSFIAARILQECS